MANEIDIAFLAKVRLIGVIEAISTLVLFSIAMPLKYLADVPIAVTIAGSIHGILFMVLVMMYALAITKVPIGRRLGIFGIAGAIIPFGPFVVDIWLKKLGGEMKTAGGGTANVPVAQGYRHDPPLS